MIPFNQDHFISGEFLYLRDKFKITTAVETGTHRGNTTFFLANNFNNTISIDKDPAKYEYAKNKLQGLPVSLYLGSSEKVLDEICPLLGNDTIFYLDAHWEKYCPLEDELRIIAKYNLKPVIAIHDFKEPTGTLGYDSYNGQDFTFEWLKPRFDAIYKDGYSHYYNTPEKSAGQKRGIIYLTP